MAPSQSRSNPDKEGHQIHHTTPTLESALDEISTENPALAKEIVAIPKHASNLRTSPDCLDDLAGTSSRHAGRIPLFDEPSDASVPGNVHLIADEALARLIEHNGALNLLRQMAKDLAERDAQITELRKRFEEREKRLKNMLFESGVARSDVERRLVSQVRRRLSRESFMSGRAKSEYSFVDTLDDQLQQAMSDQESDHLISNPKQAANASGGECMKEQSLRNRNGRDLTSNPQSSTASPDSVRARRTSILSRMTNGLLHWDTGRVSPPRSQGTVRETRSSSTASEDNNMTPRHDRTKSKARDSSTRPQAKSNTPSNDESDCNNIVESQLSTLISASPQDTPSIYEDSRTNMSEQNTSGAVVSPKPTEHSQTSAKDEACTPQLKRGIELNSSGSVTTIQELHARIRSLSVPRTGESRTAPVIRDTAQAVLKSANIGKVLGKQSSTMEMATFIPDQDQPPTMLPAWNKDTIDDQRVLTDRYGFRLFDARAMRRATNDELYPEALLESPSTLESSMRHDPEVATVSTISSTVSETGVTHPARKIGPPASRAVKDNSKAFQAMNPATTPPRPLSPETTLNKSGAVFSNEKSSAHLLMLSQLDVYGAELAKQEHWNTYLKKTRADRYTANTAENEFVDQNEDELLGLASMGIGKMGKERLKELHSLILGGIPMVYRPKIWSEMTGAYMMKEPVYYEELLSHGADVDMVCVDQIDLDLKRTMPSNVFFAGVGLGVAKLRRVLLAFSRHNPDVGYCQGMNVIAATLLLIHPKEEDAFFVMACIIEKILPPRYFTPDLLTSRANQIVLKHLVKVLCPKLHARLQLLAIDLEAVTFGWFLSLFTDCLPVELLFRVWDIFFLEGRNYLFYVAVAIIRIHEKVIIQAETTGQAYMLLKELSLTKDFNVDEFVKIVEQIKTTIKHKNYDMTQLQKEALGELIPGEVVKSDT